MYTSESNSGHTVKWNPEDSQAAADALADVSGTGVSTATEAKNNSRVDLGTDHDVARQVRERYEELITA